MKRDQLKPFAVRALVAFGLVTCGWIYFEIPVLRRYPADVINSVGMRFCRLPPGHFGMGARESDRSAEPDERPLHSVHISRSFLMGQFEVTQSEFESVMGANPSWFQADRGRKTPSSSNQTLPVEMVSWFEAVEFCRRLSGLPEELKAGRTYRLPTEAEWEYACRGGTDSRFAFGDTFHGWEANMGNRWSHTLPGGSFRPNHFGLYDMHGNVLEWCHDWHSDTYYQHSPKVDPQGPSTPDADHHVLRGGGWAFRAASAAFRDRIPSHFKGPAHGFRIVCEESR